MSEKSGIKFSRELTPKESKCLCNLGTLTCFSEEEGGFMEDNKNQIVHFMDDLHTSLYGEVDLLLKIAKLIQSFGIQITRTSTKPWDGIITRQLSEDQIASLRIIIGNDYVKI